MTTVDDFHLWEREVHDDLRDDQWWENVLLVVMGVIGILLWVAAIAWIISR